MRLVHDPLREGEIPREQTLQPRCVADLGRTGRVSTTELNRVQFEIGSFCGLGWAARVPM
jgi:hypothetical protein